MRRFLSLAAATLLLLAGCSSGNGTTGGSSGQQQPSAAASGSGSTADAACSGGLKGTEPGVVRIACDGPAAVRIQAGTVTKDLHGGRCQSVGDRWSVSAGVIIDATGVHGTYAGPPVSSVTVNNTSTPGKATIQAVLDGRHYFDLGNATLTLSSQGTTAHVEGVSEASSDAPGARIIVDVTC